MRFSFPLMLIEYPVRNRAEPLFKELIIDLSSPLFCFVLLLSCLCLFLIQCYKTSVKFEMVKDD